jgi:hypothetical protein
MAILLEKFEKEYLTIANKRLHNKIYVWKYKPILIQTGFIKLHCISGNYLTIKSSNKIEKFANIVDTFSLETCKSEQFATLIKNFKGVNYLRFVIDKDTRWSSKKQINEFYKLEDIELILDMDQDVNLVFEIRGCVVENRTGMTNIHLKQVILSQAFNNDIEEEYSNTRKLTTCNISDDINNSDSGETSVSQHLNS